MAVERSMHVPVVSPLACGAVPLLWAPSPAGPGASAGQRVRVCFPPSSRRRGPGVALFVFPRWALETGHLRGVQWSCPC